MSTSSVKPIANLGPPRVTRDRNYLRLFIAILFLLAISVVVGYAWKEGYVSLLNTLQTTAFSVVFAVLLTYAVLRATVECYHYARCINAIKSDLSTEDLKALLQVTDFSEGSVGLIKDSLGTEARQRIDSVENIEELAPWIGLIGTFLGVIIGLLFVAELAQAGGIKAVQENVAGVMFRLAVAPATSLSGAIVAVIARQYARAVRTSAEMYITRVLRVVHSRVAPHSTNDPR